MFCLKLSRSASVLWPCVVLATVKRSRRHKLLSVLKNVETPALERASNAYRRPNAYRLYERRSAPVVQYRHFRIFPSPVIRTKTDGSLQVLSRHENQNRGKEKRVSYAFNFSNTAAAHFPVRDKCCSWPKCVCDLSSRRSFLSVTVSHMDSSADATAARNAALKDATIRLVVRLNRTDGTSC